MSLQSRYRMLIDPLAHEELDWDDTGTVVAITLEGYTGENNIIPLDEYIARYAYGFADRQALREAWSDKYPTAYPDHIMFGEGEVMLKGLCGTTMMCYMQRNGRVNRARVWQCGCVFALINEPDILLEIREPAVSKL